MNFIFCKLKKPQKDEFHFLQAWWKNTLLVRDPAAWLRFSILVLYKRLGSGWTSTNQLGPAPIAMLHILQIKKSLYQKWISRNATCQANVLIRTRHDCTVRALLHIKNQHGTALVAIGGCSVETIVRTDSIQSCMTIFVRKDAFFCDFVSFSSAPWFHDRWDFVFPMDFKLFLIWY